jgi:type II secretory ATPase GspE/PulE/Tfp pilus assembly ATPase PilB-like protein
VAVYEFFVMSEDIADQLAGGVSTGHLRNRARQHGWHSLREQSWKKVQQGLIPVAEIQRLTHRIRQPSAQPLLPLA